MILTESLQLGRIAIAYLYQNAITQDRADNFRFYDEVTKEGVDLPEMQQLPGELVLLQRVSPEHMSEVRVGRMQVQGAPPGVPVQAPFRLLIAEQGSTKSIKIFQDNADSIASSFHTVWGGRVGRLQLVEVSIVASVQVSSTEGAAAFIRDDVTHVGAAMRNHLGRNFNVFGMKLGSGMFVVQGAEALPLGGAHLELSIDSNPQDVRLLQVTLAAKWQALQLRVSDMQIPDQAKEAIGKRDFIELNVEAKQPETYVSQVYNYLQQHVIPFLAASGQ
jgi:hypothetical protein